MDSELAALAASGATTLVSLMVTDSWTHAREVVGRFLARIGSDGSAIADLDNARTRLLNTGATEDVQAIADVIQSGRITGLTFHVHQPPAPNQG